MEQTGTPGGIVWQGMMVLVATRDTYLDASNQEETTTTDESTRCVHQVRCGLRIQVLLATGGQRETTSLEHTAQTCSENVHIELRRRLSAFPHDALGTDGHWMSSWGIEAIARAVGPG